MTLWSIVCDGQTYLNLQARAAPKVGSSKSSSSFLKASTTTLLHTISESEKASYVAHINSYLRDDPFLKQFLPIYPASNALFDLAKDGVLLWYLNLTCFVMLQIICESMKNVSVGSLYFSFCGSLVS